MKIGEFAKKHNTTKATIRYYTDLKLLLPSYDETYPNYDDCMKDMKDILMFQKLGFTNKEILNLKMIQRYYITRNEHFVSQVNRIFNHKIKKHKHQIEELNDMIDGIQNLIRDYSDSNNQKTSGISLNALEYLNCPDCHESFELKNANIKHQTIIKGILSCSCGDHYKIENGMIVPLEETVQLPNIRSEPKGDFENHHFALLKKTGDYIVQKIEDWDHSRGILFMGSDVLFFMRGLERCFKKDGMYFICCTSMNTAERLRLIIQSKKLEASIIIVYSNDKLPLSPMIPYFVDLDSNLLDYRNDQALGHHVSLYDHDYKEKGFGIYVKNVVHTNGEHAYYLDQQSVINSYIDKGYSANVVDTLGTFTGIPVFKRILEDDLECEVYLTEYSKEG